MLGPEHELIQLPVSLYTAFPSNPDTEAEHRGVCMKLLKQREFKTLVTSGHITTALLKGQRIRGSGGAVLGQKITVNFSVHDGISLLTLSFSPCIHRARDKTSCAYVSSNKCSAQKSHTQAVLRAKQSSCWGLTVPAPSRILSPRGRSGALLWIP